jgi:hypothetical protein
MTARLAKAFAAAVAKGVPFLQVRDLFKRCGPLIVAQTRANVVGESNA